MSFKDQVNFCLNLLKMPDSSEKSCIYSPLSMLNSLAMMYAGSDGNTANQIAAIIGKDKNKDEVISYYSDLFKLHKEVKDVNIHEVVKNTDVSPRLSTVEDNEISFKLIRKNNLFFDKRIKILDSFKKIISEKFDGKYQQVNFKEEKDDAVKTINAFVNDSTNGLIKEIYSSRDIKDETEMIIINAIYFIGRWATPFNDRQKEIFYSKIPREIDLMSKTMACSYVEGEDWKCVGIPYLEWKVWMFILLPNANVGLHNLIDRIDYSMFIECTKGEIDIVDVTVPVFDISTEFDLVNDFAKLGITDIFNPSLCNFSKIFDNESGGRNSCIDKAIQKAIIKTDEYGTEAAAVTRMDRVRGCMPRYFKADHPFTYFIASVDKRNVESLDLDQQEIPTEILFAGTFC